MSGLSRIIAVKSPLAPDHANIGRFSGLNTATSVVRAERTGPTGSEPCEWKIAASRVTEPSTSSSYTMSAWFRPSCGRAVLPEPPSALSIFTTSAGRFSTDGSVATRPVSGAIGGAVVVVVALSDVVPPDEDDDFLPPPPQAASDT